MSNGRKQFSRKNSNYTKTLFDAEDTLIYIFILHLFYLSRQIAFDWRIIFYHTVTDRNIAFFSGTHSTCYLLNFGNLIENPVHFLLTENIRRGNQGIII